MTTDSVFCDQCKITNHSQSRTMPGELNARQQAKPKVKEDNDQDIWQDTQPRVKHTQPSGPQIIAHRLQESQETQEIIIKAMNQAKGCSSRLHRSGFQANKALLKV